MTATATVVYGWKVDLDLLPQEIVEKINGEYYEKDLYGRYALAAWLLHNDDPSCEIGEDTVTDLEAATGIWLDEHESTEVVFLSMRHLVFNQTDDGIRRIALTQPTEADRRMLTSYATTVLGVGGEPGWYLTASTI